MKNVFLTIDDGPSERCTELIEFLSSKRIGAVFFCRGDNLAKRPEAAVTAIQAGFIIGNHSSTHADFNLLNESQARNEIESTHDLIEALYFKAGASRPRSARWFRFPYGHRGANNTAIQSNQKILHKLGYWNPLDSKRLDWSWNIDCEDWHVNEENAEAKLAFAKERLKALHDGSVLDLHDQETNVSTRLFQRICETATAEDGAGITFHDNAALLALTAKK
jgi:peptidoglycan/xylan/chitin deacetylase (PgdA/CDA1 family)